MVDIARYNNKTPIIIIQTNMLLQNSPPRQHNLELLRIVAMFMVLAIHYNLPVRGEPTIEALHNDAAYTSITILLQSILIVCVNCFILISGYFGIHWKRRSFLNLCFQVLFWIVVGYGITFIPPFGNKPSVQSYLMEVLSKWFVWCYFGLYLFSPVLNAFVEKCSTRQLVLFVVVFYAFSTVFGYFTKSVADFNEGMSVISLVGLYLLGRTLFMGENQLRLSSWQWLVAYLACVVILFVLTWVAFGMGIQKMPQGYLNPIVIIESVCLFMFFKNIHINSPVILFFSSSAYAVFLMHIFPFDYYTKALRWIVDNPMPWYLRALSILSFMVAVFIVAVHIDKLRMVLFSWLRLMLHWKSAKKVNIENR